MISIEQLKEIVNLAESVPQEYRQKCFEILLSHYVSGRKEGPPAPSEDASKKEEPDDFTIPIDVKAFMNQFSIDESSLSRLFFIEGSDVRPIYKLKTTKKAAAQIQYALLLAFENALLNGEFKFSVEALRQRCKDHKAFDQINFKTILRNKSSLFKSLKDEESVALSPEGKSELADAIEALLGE